MIEYHYETEYEINNPEGHTAWLGEAVASKGFVVGELHFIFCSDDYLLDVNRKFLEHDYLTDIITFPGDTPGVSGDLFISVDRVAENASLFDTTPEEEIRRVMIHGVLHLMGMDDATPELKEAMHRAEDELLQLFHVKH